MKSSLWTYLNFIFQYEDRDSVYGIATRHELEGPGFESRWGRSFPHASRPALPPPSLPASYTMATESFSGVKWPGRGFNQSPPYSVEVKE